MRAGRLKVKAGLLLEAFDTTSLASIVGRRAWVLCSVLCFYNQNLQACSTDLKAIFYQSRLLCTNFNLVTSLIFSFCFSDLHTWFG